MARDPRIDPWPDDVVGDLTVCHHNGPPSDDEIMVLEGGEMREVTLDDWQALTRDSRVTNTAAELRTEPSEADVRRSEAARAAASRTAR